MNGESNKILIFRFDKRSCSLYNVLCRNLSRKETKGSDARIAPVIVALWPNITLFTPNCGRSLLRLRKCCALAALKKGLAAN